MESAELLNALMATEILYNESKEIRYQMINGESFIKGEMTQDEYFISILNNPDEWIVKNVS